MTRRSIVLGACGACPALIAFQNEPKRMGKPPRLLSKIEPEYSDEARKARLSGTVLLNAVIRPDGHAGDVKVVRALGLGLDEQAVSALERWQFQPGEKEGQPVSVQSTIEVGFRLLPNHRSQAEWYTQRVAFQTPPDVLRPTLEFAKFPPNGDPPEPGSLSISCLIDEMGIPTALRAEKSTANTLDAEAMAFVRQWRFKPATKAGKPVAVAATIDVAFGSPGVPQPKPKGPTTTL